MMHHAPCTLGHYKDVHIQTQQHIIAQQNESCMFYGGNSVPILRRRHTSPCVLPVLMVVMSSMYVAVNTLHYSLLIQVLHVPCMLGHIAPCSTKYAHTTRHIPINS